MGQPDNAEYLINPSFVTTEACMAVLNNWYEKYTFFPGENAVSQIFNEKGVVIFLPLLVCVRWGTNFLF